jgi:hypothetical protein
MNRNARLFFMDSVSLMGVGEIGFAEEIASCAG